MTDELITALSQISALRVISRTSIMTYKGVRKLLPEIAREPNVEAVVEGTVLRFGDRVRITAQLIGLPVERHIWAQSFEGDLRDTLALQTARSRYRRADPGDSDSTRTGCTAELEAGEPGGL